MAALIGLTSGLFVTQLRIPSFLVTLGMLLVVRGAALWLTQGFPQRTWSGGVAAILAEIIVGDFFVPTPFGDVRVYMSLFWFALLAVVLGYVLMVVAGSATGSRPPAATPSPLRLAAFAWRAPRSRSSS